MAHGHVLSSASVELKIQGQDKLLQPSGVGSLLGHLEIIPFSKVEARKWETTFILPLVSQVDKKTTDVREVHCSLLIAGGKQRALPLLQLHQPKCRWN